jgi:hypothetical protein
MNFKKYSYLLTESGEVVLFKMVKIDNDSSFVIDKRGNVHQKGWVIPITLKIALSRGDGNQFAEFLKGKEDGLTEQKKRLYKKWASKFAVYELKS